MAFFFKKNALVIATGWIGDTVACTAAATSLNEKGYQTTLLIRWPQLKPILDNDSRFKTKTYWHVNWLKLIKPLLNMFFDVVVWEPKKWSYVEPFTSEIRRLAGCTPFPEYRLTLSQEQLAKYPSLTPESTLPIVAIGRDIYKRAYGRDLHEFIELLKQIAQIEWIGLDPNQNSKSGKKQSLADDAARMIRAAMFIGVEGGLLWIAAGLGKKCIYFTEHIVEIEKITGLENLNKVLGSKSHFPNESKLIELPAFCSNQTAIDCIKKEIR